jgi:Leucine-rich repeat (LRR) protein
LGSSIPSLTTLVLTSNNLSELADVESLRSLHKLTHLVLLENPITRKEVGKIVHYQGYPGLYPTDQLTLQSRTIGTGLSGWHRPCDSSTTKK